MADTLAEIYRDTLVSSDFNSSGEATIVTTDSSTSHVIKSIQAKETDTDIPVGGTLQINEFDIVELTANSSGTEIIAPSSTVKVKATGFPLRYTDAEFNVRTSAATYSSTSIASVNGKQVINEIYDATNTIGNAITYDGTKNVFAPFIGSNHYIYVTNHNSTTQAFVINDASGNAVYSQTNSYTPKWFDGKEYAYYYDGNSPQGIYRIDIAAGSSSIIKSIDVGGNGGDPKIFGVKDEYLWFWTSADNTMYVYDFVTGSVNSFGATPNSTYGSWTHNRGMYAVKRSNGSYRFVMPYAETQIRYIDYSVGDVHTSSTSYVAISLNGVSEHFREYQANCSEVGSKLYYVNNDSQKIAYWDFDPDTPTHGVIGTNQLTQQYGFDLTHVEKTPSASTVAGRTYGISPSLKLRITGVTST